MKQNLGLVFLLAIFIWSTGRAEAAAISGTVRLEGAPPEIRTVDMRIDHACPEADPDQSVQLDAAQHVKNVFVYIKKGIESQYSAPETPVVLDQKNCQYLPRVFGIQVGQPLVFANEDATLHNVFARAADNRPFNFGMQKNMEVRKTFKAPEVMVEIKCNVHAWMRAYAGVVEHPFYAVTDGEGRFYIANVPAGKYVIEAWHERFGTQEKKVSISENDSAELEFVFSGKT